MNTHTQSKKKKVKVERDIKGFLTTLKVILSEGKRSTVVMKGRRCILKQVWYAASRV